MRILENLHAPCAIVFLLLLVCGWTIQAQGNTQLWLADGSVTDVYTGDDVPGVTIIFTVAYSTTPWNLPPDPDELAQLSQSGVSDTYGHYTINISHPSNCIWIWKKLQINENNLPSDVQVTFPGSNNAPRYFYNLQYVPNPPNPNWTSENWIVWDHYPSQPPPPPPPPPWYTPPPSEDDQDADGISDANELMLAQKFSPVLHGHGYDKQIGGLANANTWLFNHGIYKVRLHDAYYA